MAIVFMTDPATHRCALYDEPVAPVDAADAADPNSPCNAPLNDPENHLPYLYFHSDLDPMEGIMIGSKTINHPLVPAGPSMPSGLGAASAVVFGGATEDYQLLDISSLGLTEPPFVIVATSDNNVSPGMPLQTGSNGLGRYGTVYVRTTEVRLFCDASQGALTLPAQSITYSILVIGPSPIADGSGIAIDYDPTTGITKMGEGKFNSSRAYLQVVPGGSPLAMHPGRSADIANGTVRTIKSDGTIFDPMPVSASVMLVPGSSTPGASLAYNGTFTGDGPPILVQAP